VQPWGPCMESNGWKNIFHVLSPSNGARWHHLQGPLARTTQSEVATARWMKWTSLAVPITNHHLHFLAQLLIIPRPLTSPWS
jgi:hypothetical protein